MIRSDFTRQLKQFLSGKSSQVWLIYGISGIGKSHILDLISKESARQSFGHLLFNKTDRKQDTIFSESLLRQASILGESISDTKAKQPIKFIKLCKKLQNISPLEQLEAGTSTSDPITFIAKIALLAPKFFGFYNYRQHPEKALFGALSGHLENKPLILLFDNFISSTSIKTKLKGVSKDGAAQWGYESSYTTEPFHSWLEKLIRYLSFKKHPVFVVVSGCNPLQTLTTMDLGLETKIYQQSWLTPFTPDDIKTLLRTNHKFEKLSDIQLADWCKRILKVTNGLPKWVAELIQIIKNTPNQDLDVLWKETEQQFHSNPEMGIQGYLIKKLTKTSSLRDQIWRLAIPFQIDKSEKFKKALFPEWSDFEDTKKECPLTTLFEAGVIQLPTTLDKHYTLHQVTRSALRIISMNHSEQESQLHKALFNYFSEENNQEAADYHQFCARYGARLLKLGMSADDYWYQTKASILLSHSQKLKWLTKTLPERDSAIKKRISKLSDEHQLLTVDMAGDAYEFIKANKKQSIQEFRNKKTLDELVKQAPHISDIVFLQSQFLPHCEERMKTLSKLVQHINPYHPLAWFELGLLEWHFGSHYKSKIALESAINFGLSPERKQIAAIFLAWLAGDLALARNISDTITSDKQLNHDLNITDSLKLLNIISDRYKQSLTISTSHDLKDENFLGLNSDVNTHPRTLKLKAQSFETIVASNNLNSNQIKIADSLSLDDREIENINNIHSKIRLTPENSSLWNELGSALLNQDDIDHEKAEAAFNESIRLDPENSSPLNGLGLLMFSDKKRAKEAEVALKESIRLEPESSSLWNNLGHHLVVNTNRYEEGEAAYKEAIRLKPKDPIAYYSLGVFYANFTIHFNEAEIALKHAIQLDPEQDDCWYALGKLLADNTDRYEESELAYRESIRLNSEESHTWIGLGTLLEKHTTLKDEAEFAYREAIRCAPSDPLSWCALGDLLAHDSTRSDEAEAAIRKAISYEPNNANFWGSLGGFLTDYTTRFVEAEKAFRKAILIDPNLSFLWDGLGHLLSENTSRFTEAEAAFKQAIYLDPESALPWNGLGILYSNNSEYLKGKLCFLKGLSLKPDLWHIWINLGGYTENETGVMGVGQQFKSIAAAGNHAAQGKASSKEYLLIASKVYLPYRCWKEIIFCTNYILSETPDHPIALGLSALSFSYLNETEKAYSFAERALSIEPFQLQATFAKVKLLLKEERKEVALELLHDLYNIPHYDADYFTEMHFMEHFIRLEDGEYVWRCAENARRKSDALYYWIPEYRLALYYWQVEKNTEAAQEIILKFRSQQRAYGEHNIVDLLEAEICFITGNTRRCQLLLDKISQDQITPKHIDEVITYSAFTSEEEQRYKQLFYSFEQLKISCKNNGILIS